MNPLAQILRRRIDAEGPLTVAEYMTAVLRHPEHGYYARKDPFGTDGDSVTAPEISQMFGELIGLWCAITWRTVASRTRLKWGNSLTWLRLPPRTCRRHLDSKRHDVVSDAQDDHPVYSGVMIGNSIGGLHDDG